MMTIDQGLNMPTQPRSSRVLVAGKPLVSPREPARHQTLRARFADADRQIKSQVSAMNQAARDFWKNG